MKADIFGGTALSEPGAGSDFSSIRTSAVKSGDGWVLNGEKGWITNAAIGDLFITYVQTDPAAGWRGIASFLVDARRPGFRRVEPYALAGGHAIGAGGFVLENYVAPEDDLLAPPGEAFKLAMQGVNGACVYVAAMCAGDAGRKSRNGAGHAAVARDIRQAVWPADPIVKQAQKQAQKPARSISLPQPQAEDSLRAPGAQAETRVASPAWCSVRFGRGVRS